MAAHLVIRSSPAAAAFMIQAASRGTRLGLRSRAARPQFTPCAGDGGDQSGELLNLDIRIAARGHSLAVADRPDAGDDPPLNQP
jgi:hypothetical protein